MESDYHLSNIIKRPSKCSNIGPKYPLNIPTPLDMLIRLEKWNVHVHEITDMLVNLVSVTYITTSILA